MPLDSEFWRNLRMPRLLNREEIESRLLDREQIREQLGLLPHAEYLSQNNLREDDRHSGRTTEMMLDVLVACQTRRYVFVDSVGQIHSSHIVEDIKRYYTDLNLRALHSNPPGFPVLPFRSQVDVFTSEERLRGLDRRDFQIFQDHSIILRNISVTDRSTAQRITAELLHDRIEANLRGIDTVVEVRSIEEYAREYAAWEQQIQLRDGLRTFSHHDFEVNVHQGEPPGNLKSSSKPAVCQGCKNYNGSSYGGNLLICGMYPYGCDTDICPDWEGKTIVLIDLLSIETNPNYRQNNQNVCVGKTITAECRGRLPEYLEQGRNITIVEQEITHANIRTKFLVGDPALLDRLRTDVGIVNVEVENHYEMIRLAFSQEQYSFKYQSMECSCGFEFKYQHHDNCPSCDRALGVEVESIKDAIARRDNPAP